MKRALVFLIPALLALVSHSGGAMTLEPAPLDVLVDEADAVVRGFVIATETIPRAPGTRQGALWTAVTIALVDVERGPQELAFATTLTLHLPGGETDTLRTYVPGVPQLVPGDEVLLLLSRRHGVWLPLGYSLGVLFIDAHGQLFHPGAGGRPGRAVPRTDAAKLPTALLREEAP